MAIKYDMHLCIRIYYSRWRKTVLVHCLRHKYLQCNGYIYTSGIICPYWNESYLRVLAFIAVAFCSVTFLYALYAASILLLLLSDFFGLGDFLLLFPRHLLLQPAIDKMSNGWQIAIADLSFILSIHGFSPFWCSLCYVQWYAISQRICSIFK